MISTPSLRSLRSPSRGKSWCARLTIVAVATLMLGGCAKGPWYDPYYVFTKPHPKKTRLAAQPRDDFHILSAVPDEFRSTATITQIPNAPVTHVQMIKLTLPLGTFSGNEKVWRQLDEDVLDSDTSLLLAHNGIRAATAPEARWKSLAALLNVPGANQENTDLMSDGRTSLNIVTRKDVEDELIYYVDRDMQSHGKTFDKCDNSLRVVLQHSSTADGPLVDINLEPVVQLGSLTLMRTPGDVGMVTSLGRAEETFANLRLSAAVKPGNFLIIAPSDPRTNRFSVGTRFLSDDDGAPPTETVLVFIPENESNPK